MGREKELAKNTIVLAIGKFIPRIISIITLPIITGYLSKSEFGIYDLIDTLVMLLIPVATLQIQSAAFRFLIDCREDENRTKKIITNIFVVTLPMSVLVSLLIAVFLKNVPVSTRLLIGSYFFVDTFQQTIGQIIRGLNHNKIFSNAALVLSVINAGSIALALLVLKGGLNGVIVSLLLANVGAVIYMLCSVHLSRYVRWDSISGDTIKRLIAYSWPMIPNNLSTWVLKLSDRLVIVANLGIQANAVYAAANKIPNMLSIAQSVLIMAWQENASLAVNDKDAGEYYSKMFDEIFRMVIGLTALLIAGTPILFWLLIRGDYDEAYVQMPILILAMLFCCMSAFQGGIYIAHKKTLSVGVTTMIAAGVNLLIDVLLVNKIGITAGSLSTLIAYLFLYVYRQIDVQRFQKVNFYIGKQILLIGMIVLMLCMCFARVLWLDVINIIFGCVFCIFINRKMLYTLYQKKVKR